MMQEGYSWVGVANAGITADPTANFAIVLGGVYNFGANGTFNSSTVSIQALAADGTTWLDLYGAYDASAAEQNEPINKLTAAGVLTLTLCPGTYRVHLGTTGMTIWAFIARCPTA